MKSVVILSLVAGLLAGCAGAPSTSSMAANERDCKVQPMRTVGTSKRPPTSLEQAEARSQLANSELRRRESGRVGAGPSLIEDALRDCN